MNLKLLISFGYMPTNPQKSAVSIKIVWGKECGDYCHYPKRHINYHISVQDNIKRSFKRLL